MNYRQRKKRLRLKALSDISKLNCTKDDVILLKFPYPEMSHCKLMNWLSMINKYIKHNTIIALPDVMTLEKCPEDEIYNWIKIATEILDKRKMDKQNLSEIIDKLSEVDEQQIIMYDDFKRLMDNTSDNIKTLSTPEYSMLTLSDKNNNEILKFENNGDIYVRGNLIENDKQVVDGFREFLNAQGIV